MATVATQQIPQVVSFGVADHTPVLAQRKSVLVTALPDLQAQLAEAATIYLPNDVGYEASVKRFSDFKRPMPGAVICPTCEDDIVATVKWATAHDIRFLARAGGHYWSMALAALGPEGVLINLRAMNDVTVDVESGTATISAGASTGEVIRTVHDANAHVACDSVGAIPSMMGGGIGNHVSNFGLAADNILSARLVTHDGSVVNVSQSENADLFLGLRGAGPNFGIVSEMTVKVHPQLNEGSHWSGMLGFPGSRETAEKVARTIETTGILNGQSPEGMSCTMIYGRPEPAYQPTVLLKLSFNGSASAAESAFAALYALTKTMTPSIQTSQMVPASELNDSKESICKEGGAFRRGNRPVHSTTLPDLDVQTMGNLYEQWEDFTTKHKNTRESIVRINCYDYRHVRSTASADSAFPWRQNPINVLQYSAYTDPRLDEEVQDQGRQFRAILLGQNQANVITSFATGDESAEAIYGHHTEKLRSLKQKWDPNGAFSFYSSL